jgi:hypothetical protein
VLYDVLRSKEQQEDVERRRALREDLLREARELAHTPAFTECAARSMCGFLTSSASANSRARARRTGGSGICAPAAGDTLVGNMPFELRSHGHRNPI